MAIEPPDACPVVVLPVGLRHSFSISKRRRTVLGRLCWVHGRWEDSEVLYKVPPSHRTLLPALLFLFFLFDFLENSTHIAFVTACDAREFLHGSVRILLKRLDHRVLFLFAPVATPLISESSNAPDGIVVSRIGAEL